VTPRSFIEVLLGGTPGVIDICTRSPDGAVMRGLHATVDEALVAIERGIANEHNVYAAPATRLRREGRSGKSNLSTALALWVDRDFRHDGDAETHERVLRPFPLPPSLRVCSGSGEHLYWCLDEQYDLRSPVAIQRFEGVLKGLCEALGGDRAATDASRLLRVPGTVNYPDAKKRSLGRRPAPCSVIEHAGHRYRFEDFAAFSAKGANVIEGTVYERREWDGTLPSRVEELLTDPSIRARFHRDWGGLEDHSDSGIDMGLATLLAYRGLEGWKIEAAIRSSRLQGGVPEKHDSYYGLTVGKALAQALEAQGDGAEGSFAPPRVGANPNPVDTDLGNAAHLAERHKRDLRFVPAWGTWLVWDGKRWARDTAGRVVEYAKGTIRALRYEVETLPDQGARNALYQHAKRSEAAPRIRAMVELARTDPVFAAEASTLNSDPWSLNVVNGTIDLKTGQLRRHRPDDLITKLAPVCYDREARSPLWETFLERVVPDPEVRGFLQHAVGYSLTGSTAEEVVFFLVGGTASGKSTLIEAVRSALGDYATAAEFETFLRQSQPRGPRNDVARLAGARFVTAVEVPPGRQFDEGALKQLTGGDTVTARFLHHEFFEFVPQFKIWLAANHRPSVRDDDPARGASLWCPSSRRFPTRSVIPR
jgi:putative DNA primase/helicase